jgi:hypothetical protein
MTLTGVGDPFSYSDNPCVSNTNHVFSVAPLLEDYCCLSPVVRIASRIEAVNTSWIYISGRGVMK